MRNRPGLRVPGTWDPLETAVKAIIDRRRTPANATETVRRLVERYGTKVPGLQQMRLTHTFPSASALASAELNDIGIAQVRAEAIRGFARAVANDEIRLDGSIELDRLVSSMASVPGIGEPIAHYIALRLGERNAFPLSDSSLASALDHLGLPWASDPAGVARRWTPWRALATTHLWAAASQV